MLFGRVICRESARGSDALITKAEEGRLIHEVEVRPDKKILFHYIEVFVYYFGSIAVYCSLLEIPEF
jgi:hypothetical protein